MPQLKISLRPLALAAALFGGAGAAQAQGLQALYDAARAFDASYLAAKALAYSANFRAEQAEAVRWPTVVMTGSITRSDIQTAASTDVNSNNEQATLQLRQPLFNRSNAATVEQGRRLIDLAKADLDAAEQDLILRVAQAYFDVLAAQDVLVTAQTSKKAIAEQLASAKRNFEVGTTTITDTREAQARFDLATAQEIAADNDLRTKRIAIDQLVGRNGIEPRPLSVPVVLPATLPAVVDEWVSKADGTHPAIRKLRLAQELARLETAKAQAGTLPTVDLVASFTDSHSSGATTNPPIGRSGSTRTGSLGVQMNWPLFTGFAVQNRIKETVVLEDKARHDLEAARRSIAQGTRQSFYGVQSLAAQVKALEAAESSSLLALEATQLGYKVGVRVNLDVLNAQTQLFQTRRDLAKARYDVVLTGLKLRQASGQLLPQDVTAVDALLAR